jgi:hypothetical protein
LPRAATPTEQPAVDVKASRNVLETGAGENLTDQIEVEATVNPALQRHPVP